VDDEIKEINNKLSANAQNQNIFKEETLTEDEWAGASDEIGYCMITPEAEWENQGFVEFDAGCLTTEEINAMLNTLPIDITFVDKNDTVKY